MPKIVTGLSIIITSAVLYSSYTTQQTVSSIGTEIREIKSEVASLRKEIQVIKTSEVVNLSNKETECLTKNVMHEAGVEPFEGKIAVAQVTYNRLKTGRWGSDICKVVFAKSQFSWTLEKKKKTVTPKGKLWVESKKAVAEFKQGGRIPELKDAKFYHTDYIKTPKWVDPNKKVEKVGQHIFYVAAK
jgi:spore germination cell wall hydrolase CwlJ-like protein